MEKRAKAFLRETCQLGDLVFSAQVRKPEYKDSKSSPLKFSAAGR